MGWWGLQWCTRKVQWGKTKGREHWCILGIAKQSTYLTLQPCHREQNTEERKGYKMQDRAVAGLHKGLGVKEPWPAAAGPEQQRECSANRVVLRVKTTGAKEEHTFRWRSGKGKVIAEQRRMVEADGWVQWTCGGQWWERERERPDLEWEVCVCRMRTGSV